MTPAADPLARTLVESGYAPLLGEYPDAARLQAVLAEPELGPRLQRIVDDRQSPWQARFLASELLFRHVDMRLHHQCDRASQGESYFQALRENYTGNGADWGFARGPDDPGVLGRTASELGAGADAFLPGLDDGRIVPVQFSWRTPPHVSLPYRVKDFAALILARARAVPIDLSGAPADRDRAIAALAGALRGAG